ncbi:TRAP transporter substrate-binding protein DctP [Parablautia muri]|uniref:TRAP transporter substrate-binding protein DctP n=1 Tax=Parablautia muri TaxID=2320879 RepID=UPI002ED31F45
MNDVCEQISRGASIIAYAGPDAFSSSAPDLAILNSQYCLTSADQIDAINQSDWFKEQAEKLAQDGNTRILSWNFFTGYRHILSKTPIETPDDLNGVQIRVADSPAAIAFVKALGCSPVVTNWNEVYSSISTNIVTACEAPLATLYSSSLQEVAQYCTLTNHLVSTGMMVIPVDIFASMPEEYQNILLEAVYQAGVDFLTAKLPKKYAIRLKQVVYFFMLLTCFFMLYLSIVISSQGFLKVSAYFRIPYFYKYISVAIGFACMIVHTLRYLALSFRAPEDFFNRIAQGGLPGLDDKETDKQEVKKT